MGNCHFKNLEGILFLFLWYCSLGWTLHLLPQFSSISNSPATILSIWKILFLLDSISLLWNFFLCISPHQRIFSFYWLNEKQCPLFNVQPNQSLHFFWTFFMGKPFIFNLILLIMFEGWLYHVLWFSIISNTL